jgi:hypothetical protein
MAEFFSPQDYEVEIAAGEATLREMAGEENAYRRRALEAQMESARAARENAMKIAQLQSETSRYGIDAQRATAMAQLKENARQFDASHGLEIAKAYTAFSSTPDMMFARNDFLSAMGRVGQSGGLPAPISSQGSPQAKTWQDFAAIASYNGSQVPGASAPSAARESQAQPAAASGSSPAASGGGSAAASTGAAGASSGTDPRVTAANAVMKAIPPSETPGTDGQDWAALEAIRNLFTAAKPGSIERLGAPRTKIAMAGLARMGYDPETVLEEYKRAAPGQQSPILAA